MAGSPFSIYLGSCRRGASKFRRAERIGETMQSIGGSESEAQEDSPPAGRRHLAKVRFPQDLSAVRVGKDQPRLGRHHFGRRMG